MQSIGSSVFNEQRQSLRKILKVKALVTTEDGDTVVARTIDIGGDGMCLSVPQRIPQGAMAMVRFELFHGGKSTSISVKSRAQYAILSSDEFKVGFQFVNLELSSMASISRFLQSGN